MWRRNNKNYKFIVQNLETVQISSCANKSVHLSICSFISMFFEAAEIALSFTLCTHCKLIRSHLLLHFLGPILSTNPHRSNVIYLLPTNFLSNVRIIFPIFPLTFNISTYLPQKHKASYETIDFPRMEWAHSSPLDSAIFNFNRTFF